MFAFASGKILKFKFTEGSNLPIDLAAKKKETSKVTFVGKSCLVVESSGKINLFKAQEELLL